MKYRDLATLLSGAGAAYGMAVRARSTRAGAGRGIRPGC